MQKGVRDSRIGATQTWRIAKELRKFSLGLLCLLSACTGTFEAGVPTIVLIGYGDKVALVEDQFFLDNECIRRGDCYRFILGAEKSVVDDSITGASPKAVAYDVVDRDGLRSELVVLSRDDEAERSFVSFFKLENINPAAPDAFDFSPKGTVEITALENPDGLSFFPTQLQVSRDGRYVAIMNDFADSATRDTIDLIDTERKDGPAFVKHLDDSIVSTTFFLDQETSNEERLYFFKQEVDTQLSYLMLLDLEEVNTNLKIPDSQSSSKQVLDSGQVQGQLVALQPDQFVPIEISATPELGEVVETSNGSKQLVPNNSSLLANVLVLSNSLLTVHRELLAEESELDTVSLSMVDGSVEPVGGFVYFIRAGANPLSVFDIQRYNADPDGSASSFITSARVLASREPDETQVKEFPGAVFISWVKGIVGGAAQAN